MSKAYLVTSGEYSDYQVHQVFLDKKLAEKYCAVRNTSKSRYADPYVIEEFEINDGSGIECDENDIRYFYSARSRVIGYDRNGRKLSEPNFNFADREPPCQIVLKNPKEAEYGTWEIIENSRGDVVIEYEIHVYLTKEDHEKASKIAQDAWAKFKAEKLGLTV